MDRSAPNPIPNSWREGGWEEGGGRRKQSKKEERERGSGDITSNN